jgi:hypothetical protein
MNIREEILTYLPQRGKLIYLRLAFSLTYKRSPYNSHSHDDKSTSNVQQTDATRMIAKQ